MTLLLSYFIKLNRWAINCPFPDLQPSAACLASHPCRPPPPCVLGVQRSGKIHLQTAGAIKVAETSLGNLHCKVQESNNFRCSTSIHKGSIMSGRVAAFLKVSTYLTTPDPQTNSSSSRMSSHANSLSNKNEKNKIKKALQQKTRHVKYMKSLCTYSGNSNQMTREWALTY